LIDYGPCLVGMALVSHNLILLVLIPLYSLQDILKINLALKVMFNTIQNTDKKVHWGFDNLLDDLNSRDGIGMRRWSPDFQGCIDSYRVEVLATAATTFYYDFEVIGPIG
jgi:hypothetical protein